MPLLPEYDRRSCLHLATRQTCRMGSHQTPSGTRPCICISAEDGCLVQQPRFLLPELRFTCIGAKRVNLRSNSLWVASSLVS